MDLSTTFYPWPSQARPPSSLAPLSPTAGLPSSALAPLSLLSLPDARPPLLIVGFADDTLRLYSLEDGEGADARLLKNQEGHGGEVSALASWEKDGERWVVSASLDRTLRRWKLSGPSISSFLLAPRSSPWLGWLKPPVRTDTDLLNPPAPQLEEPTTAGKGDTAAAPGAGGMTAEEERELAELMGSDVDDD